MKSKTSPNMIVKRFIFSLLFISLFFTAAHAQIIATYAGNGVAGFSGDGGQATAAEINQPTGGVKQDAAGNLYIAAKGNDRIRLVNTSGTISTIAGIAFAGFSGDGGQATAAELNSPFDLDVDSYGNIYIADAGNNRIRKVNTSGVISTIVGNGTAGSTGDGGAATAAEVNNPDGIAIDIYGDIFISEQGGNRIREINTSGVISTVAGNGAAGYTGDGAAATAAELNHPYDVEVDAVGNLFIGDANNHRVRKVNTSGVISTFAGNGTSGNNGNGGQATAAELTTPTGVTIDAQGNLYIVDAGVSVIRKINTSGVISRVAGNSTGGYSGDNGQATGAELNTPHNVTFDNSGNMYIADNGNNRIRVVYLFLSVSTSVTTNVACNGGSNGSASVTVSNGTTPYTYSWSGGGTNTTKTGLSAGTYTITVTDNVGVTGSATVSITQPSALNVTPTVTNNVSCNGGNNGSVSSTPSGGTSPYTYSWSGGGTNSTKTGLSIGTYTISITDNNGCTATNTATISQPSTLIVTANVITNVSCYGESNGIISATPSGGTIPYTYSWSGGGTNSTKTGLSIGTYTISITDNNGCTASSSATITQPAVLKDSLASIGYPHGYTGTGSASIGVRGGTPPYTYTWNPNVSSTASAAGLTERNYTVTVNDKNACSFAISFGPYRILSATQTIYINGLPATKLFTCGEDTISYKITESPRTNDIIYIKLPTGITFNTLLLLKDSNVSTTNIISHDSIFSFNDSIFTDSVFRISIIVNTPPCNAISNPNDTTKIWGDRSTDTIRIHTNLNIVSPTLTVSDTSFPKPRNLNVGNIGEFVYMLENTAVNGSTITSINFRPEPSSNILYLDTMYYLTRVDSVLSKYFNKYSYPYDTVAHPHHNQYHLSINSNNNIDSTMIRGLIGIPHLSSSVAIYLHIPFIVTKCGEDYGINKFYLGCGSTSCADTIPEESAVNVNYGPPGLSAIIDTPFNNGSYCPIRRKDTTYVNFTYTDTAATSPDTGYSRADSMKIYLYCNANVGKIDTLTIKLNDTNVWNSKYDTFYLNNGFNVYLIDLTKHPAGNSGQPFGKHSIRDWNGKGYADQLAEGQSFKLSAKFIYDTLTCPPFSLVPCCAHYYLPAVATTYNNQCFTLPSTPRIPPESSLNPQAIYEFSYGSLLNIDTIPTDITDTNNPFLITICPNFSQSWNPQGFNFDCPNGYYTLNLNLPKGYHLNAKSNLWRDSTNTENSQHSNTYSYNPLYIVTNCNDDNDTLNPSIIRDSINPPLFTENYLDSTLTINFGNLVQPGCNVADNLSCIDIPIVLDCSQIPLNSLEKSRQNNFSYSMQYICDSGCSNCENILTEGNFFTNNHCDQFCTSVVPFTDPGWTFLRTNFGYINQKLPKYYTTSCVTTDSAVVPTIADALINNNILNLSAAYPADQVEAIVKGGYSGFVFSNYSKRYLQIRYEPISVTNNNIFKVDPTDTSTFVITGCIGVKSLNGLVLKLPSYPDTSITHSPLEMNFSIDTAIWNTNSLIYDSLVHDTYSETFSVTANIHLRVISNTSVINYSSQEVYPINLRTEYMCVNNTDTLPPPSHDTIHSCDSWGFLFNLYEPSTSLQFGQSQYSVSTCSTFPVSCNFACKGAMYLFSKDDFPYEFRPFAELDSVVTFVLPPGYTYLSSTFNVMVDDSNSDASDNYFRHGDSLVNFFIKPAYQSNTTNPLLKDSIVFKGLDSTCFPLFDQKFNNVHIPACGITVYTQPACNASEYSKFYLYAGCKVGTQQSDPSFQSHYELPQPDTLVVVHQNPVVYINLPNQSNDSINSNIVTFKFDLCDSTNGDSTNDAWFAIQNVGGDLLYIDSATLVNIHTDSSYTKIEYADSAKGVIFNLGKLGPGRCDTLLLTATINPTSKSCPPPVGGSTGKLNVLFGNVCSKNISIPDSACQDKVNAFYYHVYKSSISLTNEGMSPNPVSLCGGLLTDSLIIKSGDSGSLSNPLFWVSLPPGVIFDSVSYWYPCNGAKHTTDSLPDTLSGAPAGSPHKLGWVLNKDLRLHGLRGTLGLSPTSDSNYICVKVYMSMDCSYDFHPITYYASGISTCSELIKDSVYETPTVDSLCCNPLLAYCLDTNYYSLTIKNKNASSYHTSGFGCEKILIEGTFRVDTPFYFAGCDVSLAPHALIEVVDSNSFSVMQGACSSPCSHLHAACDTMWRGIFVHPGSILYTIDQTLIEDADTAVFAMNTSSSEGMYHLSISTFNKNYKDIVVTPYPGHFNGTSANCIYTCRNYDSILNAPSHCISMGTGGNWGHAPFTTLNPPFTGQRTEIGWEIDTVRHFIDSVGGLPFSGGKNIFDNLTEGIYSKYSGITLYSDSFQYINSSNIYLPAIYAEGNPGQIDHLIVGGPGKYEPNIFRHCTTGVIATSLWFDVNVSHNKFHFDTSTTRATFGVMTFGPMKKGSKITIDSNIIDSASIAIFNVMNTYTHAQIDSNVITGASLCGAQAGIFINELGSIHAIYSIKNNRMQALQYGVYVNDAVNDTIYKNNILLADTLCSSPVGIGIAITGGQNAQIVDNTVRMPYHNTSAEYANDVNLKGIYVEMSQSCYMTCNNTYYFDTAITCSGVGDVGFSVWGNMMTAGPNTGYSTGIELPYGSLIGRQHRGSILHPLPSDNEWDDPSNFHCLSSVPYPTNDGLSPFYIHYGINYIPDGGICTPQLDTIPDDTGSIYSCANIPPVIHFDLLDTIAKTKITYIEYPDTTLILAKQALANILWNNTSLLSESILYAFNDSIIATSLGEIMTADTMMANENSSLVGTPQWSYMNTLTPASNIEANLQTVGQIVLNARSTGTTTLTSTQIAALQTLANKCPYTDGVGVYQARSVLAFYTGDFTIYNDEGCGSGHGGHGHIKKIEGTGNGDTTKNIFFNLYPNPSNGSFNLVYNLGNETTGKFEIFNDISMEIGEYLLNSSSGLLQISNQNLRQGVYFYKVFTDTGIKKVGKIVIIR
jgi:sugar lactone lactonase YvrE